MNKLLAITVMILCFTSSDLYAAGEKKMRKPNSEVTCSIVISSLQYQVKNDGTVDDEERFLKASSEALSVCKAQAKVVKADKVVRFIDAGIAACKSTSDQKSLLYLGTCHLRVGKATDLMIE